MQYFLLFGWESWHPWGCRETANWWGSLAQSKSEKPQTKPRGAHITWSLLSSSWSFRYASSLNTFENLVKIHYLNAGSLKGFFGPNPILNPWVRSFHTLCYCRKKKKKDINSSISCFIMINKLIEVISIKHSIVCCFTGWHSWGLRVCFHLLTVHRSQFVAFPTPSGETGVDVWQPSDPEQSWLSELGHCKPKELMHSHLPGLLHSLKTLKHLIWVLILWYSLVKGCHCVLQVLSSTYRNNKK